MRPGGPQIQMVMPLTPVVKKLIIANVALWIVGVLILQKFMGQTWLFDYFALVPYRLITDFWLWQPFTYMFLHSDSIFHILFNMFILWWAGGELENHWGRKNFLSYYIISGAGAAIIYVLGVTIYYLFTGNQLPMGVPVIGASGAVFGLMLAYGIIFGERVIYFMALFPMKAKHFVMLLGAIEVFTLLNDGFANGVANLCHLGGLVVGYIYLVVWTRWRRRGMGGKGKKGGKPRGNLRLVVNNEEKQDDGPRYWN